MRSSSNFDCALFLVWFSFEKKISRFYLEDVLTVSKFACLTILWTTFVMYRDAAREICGRGHCDFFPICVKRRQICRFWFIYFDLFFPHIDLERNRFLFNTIILSFLCSFFSFILFITWFPSLSGFIFYQILCFFLSFLSIISSLELFYFLHLFIPSFFPLFVFLIFFRSLIFLFL